MATRDSPATVSLGTPSFMKAIDGSGAVRRPCHNTKETSDPGRMPGARMERRRHCRSAQRAEKCQPRMLSLVPDAAAGCRCQHVLNAKQSFAAMRAQTEFAYERRRNRLPGAQVEIVRFAG